LRRKDVRVCAGICDVGKRDALRAFLDTARRELGSVDVLVNNASAFGFSDDEDGWQVSFNVDLMGAVRASQIVTPWMAVGGGGAIVHISSLSGIEARSPPAYAAAKAALISHSKNLARALAPRGIRVNAVAPESIEFPKTGYGMRSSAPIVPYTTQPSLPHLGGGWAPRTKRRTQSYFSPPHEPPGSPVFVSWSTVDSTRAIFEANCAVGG
jgi:NAD(P)-dependent dehydrogenase (short-subunit alcohol dehydrogenase family)